MKSKFSPSGHKSALSSTRKSGFTLIEVMVALAIFAVLMVVVFVPLTQATRFLAVGRTRAELQQSANTTMSQLQRDLSRAIYVYPNDVLPGVTDNVTYGGFAPYFRGTARDASTGNTSRIDMLLPELDGIGNVKYPITPAKYIVTYYARRFDTTKDYDPYGFGVGLYRAQYPYKNADNTDVSAVNVNSNRYTTLTNVEWLRQNAPPQPMNQINEFNLESFCGDAASGGLIPGSHSLATPRSVQLVVPTTYVANPAVGQPNNQLLPNNGLKPSTTFTCIDTNSDGKIDQVSVSLILTNFNRQVTGDGGNDSTKPVADNINFQKFTLNQSFNCPNVR